MRFSGGGGGADTTVKLRAGRTYRLAVAASPPLAFDETATVRTRRAECYEPSLLEACCGMGGLGGRLGGRLGGGNGGDGGMAGAVKYADLGATEWSDGVVVAVTTGGTAAPAQPAAASSSSGGGAGGEVPRTPGRRRSTTSHQAAAGGAQAAAAQLEWACDMAVTGRGVRGEVEVELSARGGYGRVKLLVQAKVYGADDARGARHGVALRCVEFAALRHGITGENRVLAATYAR